MKATRSGAIIGTAMATFEGQGIGKILVFVKNGSSVYIENQEEISETSINQIIVNLINKISEFFINTIHTKTLCVGEENNETCITKAQLDELLLKNVTPIETQAPTIIPENTPIISSVGGTE
jgi:hypothetical protein